MRTFFRATNLSSSYEKKVVFSNVSLEVKKGQTLAIVGQTGAGKTTLLKCLAGLLEPCCGEVAFREKLFKDWGRKEWAKKVGYVPQMVSESFFPYHVEEVVLMSRFSSLGYFGGFKLEDHEAVSESLEKLSISHLRKRTLNTLSGGELKKVFLSMALSGRPEILFLDEPTTFLDPKNQLEMREILQELQRAASLSLVFVTHDINEASIMADSVLALNKGKVVYDGGVDGFLDESVLARIYERSFWVRKEVETGKSFVLPFEKLNS